MGNIDDKCLSRFMFCNKFHKKSVSMAVRMALIPMLMLPAASQAVITVPVHSEDRVHFADLNILEPGEYDEKYFDQDLGPADREVSEDELSAMNLGLSYFWDILKGDFQAQKPVQILIVPYSVRDDNAFAFSLNYSELTELAAAWKGEADLDGNVAVIGLDRPMYADQWYTDTLPVLPAQGINSDLPGTILHELFHAFGLGTTLLGDSFDKDDLNRYTLLLHDAYGRSVADLAKMNSTDRRIRVKVLYLGDEIPTEPLEPECFYIYSSGRYSGMYFSGPNVFDALDGAKIGSATDVDYDLTDYQEAMTSVPGLPINGLELNYDGSVFFEGSHIELQNSLMSHQTYRNWGVLMEAELALLQDLGFNFDRKRFFGYSVYGSGLTIDNDHGYWARNEDGTDWVYGMPSNQSWGIGLHVYGSDNTVRQRADILTDGHYGIGVRVDGVGNDLTIASGTTVEANGYGGKGILFSWGKNHRLTIEEGASVTALGEDGVAVAFDFGSNVLGDNWNYLGSYTSTRFFEDTGIVENNYYIPDELKGALIESFTLSGSVKGDMASVYISPNAYVKEIVVTPGAEIEGDILSLWNPDSTLYGTEHMGYEGKEPLITTLTFGNSRERSNESVIEFNDIIWSNQSMVMNVSGTTLKFNGAATVLGVSVKPGATLEGGYFNLSEKENVADSGSLQNSGTVVSTVKSPVVISGNYHQSSSASLTLSVSDGKFVPMTVEGKASVEDNAHIIATPEGGWHADGLISVDADSPIINADDMNLGEITLDWVTAENVSPSPTLSIENTTGGLVIKRKDNAYSQYVSGEAREVAQIFDASAATLSNDLTQTLFAYMDWSDTEGAAINEAADALSGKGVTDGVAGALMLERIAEEALRPQLSFAQADGEYVWVNPFGATASVLAGNKTRFDVAGLAGGWIKKSQHSTVGFSVAALDSEGKSQEAHELDAKGLWLSAFIRNDVQAIPEVFWESALRLGYMNADEKRALTFGDFYDSTQADIERWSFGASVKTGLTFNVNDNFRFEPYAQLAGSLLYSPSYSEDSEGLAALDVDSGLYRTLEARVGVTAEGAAFTEQTAYWRLHASYGRELLSDAGDMKAAFRASDLKGSFDRTVQWDSKNRFRAGLKLGIENREGLSFNARVDGQWESSDTHAVAGGVEATWRF